MCVENDIQSDLLPHEGELDVDRPAHTGEPNTSNTSNINITQLDQQQLDITQPLLQQDTNAGVSDLAHHLPCRDRERHHVNASYR